MEPADSHSGFAQTGLETGLEIGITKAVDVALGLSVPAMWVLMPKMKTAGSDPGGLGLAVAAVLLSAVCLFAVKMVLEYARVDGRSLTPPPLEDRTDSPAVYAGKCALYVGLHAAALFLPLAGYVALSGEPWPELPGLWFAGLVFLGALPVIGLMRHRYRRRRLRAQTRTSGVLTD